MPRYRVTLRRTVVEIVEAPNPYQAAIIANVAGDGATEIVDVRPAVGRPAGSHARTAAKRTKMVARKRRAVSPEVRAKLAQNLVKARAARAVKARATKKVAKKNVAKKSLAKKSTKKSARKTAAKRR